MIPLILVPFSQDPLAIAAQRVLEHYQAQLPDLSECRILLAEDQCAAQLRAELLKAQFELRNTDIPVVVIVSGVEAAGKGETVKRLHEWLDPRGLETFRRLEPLLLV